MTFDDLVRRVTAKTNASWPSVVLATLEELGFKVNEADGHVIAVPVAKPWEPPGPSRGYRRRR